MRNKIIPFMIYSSPKEIPEFYIESNTNEISLITDEGQIIQELDLTDKITISAKDSKTNQNLQIISCELVSVSDEIEIEVNGENQNIIKYNPSIGFVFANEGLNADSYIGTDIGFEAPKDIEYSYVIKVNGYEDQIFNFTLKILPYTD